MDLSPEHVSRWENDHKGLGGAGEKLVRHNVCALLSDGSCEYAPKTIANMQFVPFPDDGISPIEMVRVGGGDGGGTDDLNLDPLLVALLKKIPDAEKGWPAAQRVRWFRTFAMNVSQIHDEDGEPVEMKIELEKEAAN
jgi:hypothetical protein